MIQSMHNQTIGASLSLLAVTLGLGLTTQSSSGAPEAETVKQLLDLTGGRRVKVTWNQGSEKETKVHYFDTKDGEIRQLPFGGTAPTAPLLTIDGKRVVVATGKAPDRTVMVYETETAKVTEIAKGPSNNVMAVWQDPKTKRDWVYVNDCGDKNEPWNVPAGKVYRFPIDKPEARELFWDRTSSHIYLMFSADGTRACFEPSWGNIGQLSVVYNDKGQVDQEKSTFKTFGGGCFPSMAPDNSYRLFRLEGDHRAISMSDADNANPRKVDVTGMLTEAQKGRNTWLTRWSADPRFMTIVAPAGADAQIWMGRFDENVTKIEKWVRVSAEKGPQCWQSHAWVAPKP